MASPAFIDPQCKRLKLLLADLSTAPLARRDAVAAAPIWGTLAGASLLLGISLSLARSIRRRRLSSSSSSERPPACPTPASALRHAAAVLLVGLYPAVLAHTSVVGRAARDAASLRDDCAPEKPLLRNCRRACEELLARKVRTVDRFNEAAFLLLAVMLPAILTGVCFCVLWCVLCLACFRVGRRGGARAGADGSAGAGNTQMPAPVARGDEGTRAWRRAGAFVMTVVVSEEGAGAEAEVCAICLAGIWTRTVVVLECEHRFHKTCVKRWLRRAPVPCCPLCKAPVPEVEAGD